ncbi:MAG: hypothetical protein IJO70_08695 [Lachnospiraceae bacterium]|nr:hypothetical protein [Lachnospiraceae bacterium]
MFDNLFDWEQPDNETLYYIKEYGKNELAKEKKSRLYSAFALLITLEFYPIFISSGLLVNHYISELSVQKEIFICILFIFIIIFCVIAYYIFTVRKKKKVLLDIKNNNIKTFLTVVREKNKKKILVQLPEEDVNAFIIPAKLYKEIEAGSPLIAIKYDNKDGFYDKYDFILNPNIIAENE